MKKILIIDTNYGFTSDVESRLILDEIENVDVVTRNNINNIHNEVDRIKPDELLIAANLIPSHPTWDFGIPVKTYCKDSEGLALSSEKNFHSYGIVHNASTLIEAIQNDRIVQVKKDSVPKNPVESEVAVNKEKTIVKEHMEQVKSTAPSGLPTSASAPKATETSEQKPAEPVAPSNESDMDRFFRENKDILLAMLMEKMAGNTVTPSNNGAPVSNGVPATPVTPAVEAPAVEVAPEEPQKNPTSSENYHKSAPSGDIRTKLLEAQRREEEERRRATQAVRSGEEGDAYMKVEEDLGNVKKPARLITIYSAKGGVGKTTIACELGTFLALTSHGRGHFRTCVVDYDIVFGDVLGTLNYNPNKASMSQWIEDIQDKLSHGKKAEEITYTEFEIEKYLQKNEDTGLYALLAPVTHEDYTKIPESELPNLLEIMLNNLVENGGFDFIICDSGNNIDDAAYLGLRKADEILLVLTQSMNAANCNSNFLYTMERIGLDLNKIKIVINKVKPKKTVGISVDELKESIVNPGTRKPFDCYSAIKDFDEIRYAGNAGNPMVYNSAHNFTKCIGEIASRLIGENFVLSQPEKKKKKLFGRRRDD